MSGKPGPEAMPIKRNIGSLICMCGDCFVPRNDGFGGRFRPLKNIFKITVE